MLFYKNNHILYKKYVDKNKKQCYICIQQLIIKIKIVHGLFYPVLSR